MADIKVRALQTCVAGGVYRRAGDVFMVDEGTPLKSENMPAVMERVDDDPPPSPLPPPAPKKGRRAKKKDAAEPEDAED